MPRRRPRRLASPGLTRLVLAASLTVPVVAHAADDLANQLKTVASIRFEGRHSIGTRVLKHALKTPSPSIWPWAEKTPFRRDFLDADSTAIRALYRTHGFLDARVDSIRVTPHRDPHLVTVTYRLTEGRRAIIRSVDFDGVSALPVTVLRKRIYAHPGIAFNPGYLVVDTARISQAYQLKGRIPRVTGEARRDSIDPLRIAIVYHVDEGPLYRFGDIYLSSPGDLHVNERLIMREMLMKKGEVYRSDRVEDSQQRLYETGLFSQVQLAPLIDSTNTAVEFDLRVRERKPRWLDAGVGTGTAERFQFTGEWGHRNLTGHALQGLIDARLAFDGNGKFLLSRGEGSILEPWLLGSRTRGQVSVYYEHGKDRADPRWVRNYDSRGFSFQLRRDLNLKTHVQLIQDNTFVVQHFLSNLAGAAPAPESLIATPFYTTHRLNLTYDRDARDNPVRPVLGSTQGASAQVAFGPLRGGSNFAFGKMQLLSTWYRPLGSSGWVYATRIRGGLIRPFGESPTFTPDSIDSDVNRVPLEDRFRIGGVNSIRGYNENEIIPSGGLAMLLGNAELRIPVAGPFGVEVFIDAGNVWSRPAYIRMRNFTPHFSGGTIEPGDVHYAFGTGGRFELPFGPLRLDLTWAAQRRARLQFAIGPAF